LWGSISGGSRNGWRARLTLRFLAKVYYVLTVPVALIFIMSSQQLHPAYRMNWVRRLTLGTRLFLNTLRVPTGTSYKTHLVMALKLFEIPPEVEGAVVECGTWKGGTAANLSLICRIVKRKLLVYDSFEGLPPATADDREAQGYQPGDYLGTLAEVRTNIGRYGAIDQCEFVQGWFQDTLPLLDRPVVLAYLDVDLEGSLDCCVRHLWPQLTGKGYIFTDEAPSLDYCALFFSERFWSENFACTPPGLIGAGTGLPLGEYYIGPWDERRAHPAQHHNAGAYTRKDMSGFWNYYPEK
jgi:O-methyltransferase